MDEVSAPGSEPTLSEVGPAVDGVRELMVWRARSDEGFWVWAHFSMDNGFIGSVRLLDFDEPVDFDDIRVYVENMAARMPAVFDMVNACLERQAVNLYDIHGFTFTAPPGTPALTEPNNQCHNLSRYDERRWYSIDGTYQEQ